MMKRKHEILKKEASQNKTEIDLLKDTVAAIGLEIFEMKEELQKIRKEVANSDVTKLTDRVAKISSAQDLIIEEVKKLIKKKAQL
jgi:hypothetical protein